MIIGVDRYHPIVLPVCRYTRSRKAGKSKGSINGVVFGSIASCMCCMITVMI